MDEQKIDEQFYSDGIHKYAMRMMLRFLESQRSGTDVEHFMGNIWCMCPNQEVLHLYRQVLETISKEKFNGIDNNFLEYETIDSLINKFLQMGQMSLDAFMLRNCDEKKVMQAYKKVVEIQYIKEIEKNAK